jgi:hypothetical protein
MQWTTYPQYQVYPFVTYKAEWKLIQSTMMQGINGFPNMTKNDQWINIKGKPRICIENCVSMRLPNNPKYWKLYSTLLIICVNAGDHTACQCTQH